MIFREKQTKDGYQYDCDDVFGHAEIVSDIRLDGDMLDGVVSLLLKQNLSAKQIKGEVQHEKGSVKYVLTPEKSWQENSKDDTDESWNATPTSTSKPGSESTANATSRIENVWTGALNSCKRFVAAFRAAWKSYQQGE